MAPKAANVVAFTGVPQHMIVPGDAAGPSSDGAESVAQVLQALAAIGRESLVTGRDHGGADQGGRGVAGDGAGPGGGPQVGLDALSHGT